MQSLRNAAGGRERMHRLIEAAYDLLAYQRDGVMKVAIRP